MEAFTSQDITDFIKMMVEAGGGYIVDDQNVIHKEKTGEVWCIANSENPPRNVKLVIYNHNQKDADVIMVNPFVEGLQTSKELQWFYITRNLVISVYLKMLYTRIIEECLKVKANQELDSNIIQLISPYVDMVDDKMYAELETVTAKIHTFCDIYWNVNKRYAELKVSVLSENFRKSFGKKIRQKTWAFLMEVAKNVFGTEDPTSVYQMKSDNHGCAKFEAFSQIFLMVFKAYRPYFILTPDFKAFDFDVMEKHISMIPLYYHRAKNLVTPTIATTKKKDTTPASPPWKPVPVVATPVEYIPPAAPTIVTPSVGVPMGVPVTVQQPVPQAQQPQAAPTTLPAIPVAQHPQAAPVYMQPPVSIGHAVAASMVQPQNLMGGMYGYPANPMIQSACMPPMPAVGQMGAPYGSMPMGYPMQQQMGVPMLGQAMGTTPVPMQQPMYPQQQPMMPGYPQQGMPMMMPQYGQTMPAMMPQPGMQYPMQQYPTGQQQTMYPSDQMAMSSIGLPIKMSSNPDNNRAAYKRG